jgi:hypothetical protein
VSEAPMPRITRARRFGAVALSTLSLLMIGLVVTGRSGQALGFLSSLSKQRFVIPAYAGSQLGPVQTLRGQSGRELARYGRSSADPSKLGRHYEALARRQALRLPNGSAPVIVVNEPNLSLVAWLDRSGWRCSMIAYPLAGHGGSRYMLIQGEGDAGRSSLQKSATAARLLDTALPSGSKVLYDLRREGRRHSFVRVPGSPAAVVGEFEKRLIDAGWTVDRKARAARAPSRQESAVSVRLERGSDVAWLTAKRVPDDFSTELAITRHPR